MATTNLQAFIATANTLGNLDLIPTFAHSKNVNGAHNVTPEFQKFIDNLKSYMDGMIKFGYETGRMEDGYGERSYHIVDLERLLNILNRIGLSRGFSTFAERFNEKDGWFFPRIVTTTVDVMDVPEQYYDENKQPLPLAEPKKIGTRVVRQTLLGDIDLETLADSAIESLESAQGVDVVTWDGKIIYGCKLITVRTMHPAFNRTVKEIIDDQAVEVDQPVSAVDSELFLVLTPECLSEGQVTNPDDELPTLKGSPMVRSPIGFFAMRPARINTVDDQPYENGTILLQSNCPPNLSYKEYDEALKKCTHLINDTRLPPIVTRAIQYFANSQAFLTDASLKAFNQMLDYFTNEEETDGVAKFYKSWYKIVGQHQNFEQVYGVAHAMTKMKPQRTADGGILGRDIVGCLTKVVDHEFNVFWAYIPEFVMIVNERGVASGTNALTSPNTSPLTIKVYNHKKDTWSEKPITKFLLQDKRDTVYFFKDGESLEEYLAINGNPKKPVIKPSPNLAKALGNQKKLEKDSVAGKRID